VPSGSPGPAIVDVRARFTVAGQAALQVLGYDLVEPNQRPVREDELVDVAPCQTAVLAIRTGGPLLDGTFPYELLIEKVGLPEGATVTERFAVDLACSNRTFTCSPAAVGATPMPTPTPAAGVLDPHFGVIYSGTWADVGVRTPPLVRREGETIVAVGELAPSVPYRNAFYGTVSPDGHRAVYFSQPPNEPWGLYLLDGARPNEQRRLVTIPGEIPWGTPVWAGDGGGVAFVANVYGPSPFQNFAPTTYSAIRLLDLATLKVTELARATDRSKYHLVAWDRATATVAALSTPDATPDDPAAVPVQTYVVFSPTGRRATQMEPTGQTVGFGVEPSTNGRDVIGVRCSAGSGCTLWTWTIGDFEGRVDRKVGAELSLGFVGFRAGTSDVGLIVSERTGPPMYRVALWSPEAGLRIVYRLGDQFPSAALFRADGSALIIHLRLNEAVVVDLQTGAVSPLPQPMPSAPNDYRRLQGSIALD